MGKNDILEILTDLEMKATRSLGNKKAAEWIEKVQGELFKLETAEEQVSYLKKCEAFLEEETPKAKKPWLAIGLGAGLLTIIAAIVFTMLFTGQKNNTAKTVADDNSATVSQISSQPSSEWEVMDYIVKDGKIIYNPEAEDKEGKVIKNGSQANSLNSSDVNVAKQEVFDYTKSYAASLMEKAVSFGIVDLGQDIRSWFEVKSNKVFLNKEGQEIYHQVTAFINRSKNSISEVGNYGYMTGLKNGEIVMSDQQTDFTGWKALKVENQDGSTQKYVYYVLVYCGNTVFKNPVPGIKQVKIDLPPTPGKKTPPSSSTTPPPSSTTPPPSSTTPSAKKDPSQDPAAKGGAPIGGGVKDEPGTGGAETPQTTLPSAYQAPEAPSQSSQSTTLPVQDARQTDPSQWTGAGTVVDSNGNTTIGSDGSVQTPDGRTYYGLTNQSSVPPVQPGANGTAETTPSSSANFAGNGEMSEPPIDD